MEQYYRLCYRILVLLLGLCVGSFLNVVIYRVPNRISLVFPASHCPNCNYVLKWYDNIPLLSYILLRGKCRSCHRHISFRYTLVEAGNMLLWYLSALIYDESHLFAFLAMVICSVSLCIFFIDAEHQIIPDRFQLILFAVGIAVTLLEAKPEWFPQITGIPAGYSLLSHGIGAASAAVVYIGLDTLMTALLKRPALGGGDIKLAIVSGFLLGWQRFLLMTLIASVSGSCYMVAMRMKNGESREIAFAPFLVLGLTVSFFFGQSLISWYLSFILCY